MVGCYFQISLPVVRTQWGLEIGHSEDSLCKAKGTYLYSIYIYNGTIFNFHNWKPKLAISIELNQAIYRTVFSQLMKILKV